jgi:hypothetical protein
MDRISQQLGKIEYKKYTAQRNIERSKKRRGLSSSIEPIAKPYHPPRPFWNIAVKQFKARLINRKNLLVTSEEYKLNIQVLQ